MCPVTLTVWFLCKSCKLNFAKVDDFIEHKKENHFIEFQAQNTSCIVFEERIAGDLDSDSGSVETKPIMLNEEFQLANDSRVETNSDPNIVSCFDDPQLHWQAVHFTAQANEYSYGDSEPNTDNLLSTTEFQYQEAGTSLSGSFQPQYNPHVLLKRLTAKEIQDASSASNLKLNVNKHRKHHFVHRPFKCNQLNCGKVFKYKRSLKAHMKCHSDVRPFGCPQCHQAFKYRHHLVDHLRIHTGERPYKCPVDNCGKTYSWSKYLCRHKKVAHPDQSSQNKSVETTPTIASGSGTNDDPSIVVSCFGDPKQPLQIADISSQTNSYFCENSESQTTTVSEPKTELVTYQGEIQEAETISISSFQTEHSRYALPKRLTSNVVQSEVPSLAINRKLNLNKNPASHFVHRPFKCTQFNCEKAYKYKNNLGTHMKSHSDLRPFGCPQCNKTFKFRYHLVEHGRMHTGERPWKCPVESCGKSFAKSTALSRHKKGVHHNRS